MASTRKRIKKDLATFLQKWSNHKFAYMVFLVSTSLLTQAIITLISCLHMCFISVYCCHLPVNCANYSQYTKLKWQWLACQPLVCWKGHVVLLRSVQLKGIMSKELGCRNHEFLFNLSCFSALFCACIFLSTVPLRHVFFCHKKQLSERLFDSQNTGWLQHNRVSSNVWSF